MDEEKWIPVKGREEHYEISSLGQIKSLVNGKVLKIMTGTKGYNRVRLHQPELKRFELHTLVCSHFHGEKPGPDYSCHHINGNKTDNRACNLEWMQTQDHHMMHREEKKIEEQLKCWDKFFPNLKETRL